MATLSATPYNRVYNFSAGPCTLPVSVLEQVRDDLINYKGAGMSVMEMSHRGKDYEKIIADTEASLRKLMGIPDDYTVLFLQGGASSQFTMIPMNFLPAGGSADYVLTGTWGQKAIEACKIEGTCNVIYSAKDSNFNHAPKLNSVNRTPGASYLHFTSNETIQGVDFMEDSNLDGTIICDISSNVLSRPMDVSKYSLLYAGAQKNMGPAGVTVVIIKNDYLAQRKEGLPPMFDYKIHADNGSMYNTPPCFSIYVCGLVYEWMLANGGVPAMQKVNEAKAAHIYGAIDSSDGFYEGHSVRENRSLMNISFRIKNDELTSAFLKETQENGMMELKGHRSVGGCRASVYNAFPEEGCKALADLMNDFAKRNG